ncbi:MAG: hypothetical protein O3A00_21855, partial [Planctomycetota bacterium]|nr:hypothetical protein [Planctomycetota bacterium]
VGTEWPQREFDLRHQLILKIGKSTFWGYAGIFTAQPAFTFPPVSTQPPLVAQPVDATVSQSVEADPMPSDEPEAASDPLDSATASAVPTPLDATGFDAEDELTEDGVMARSNADAVDDEMWD